MKHKPQREDRVVLSPAMQAVVREALTLRGWSAEGIDDLLSSGLLDRPGLKAQVEEALVEAFRIAVAKAGLDQRSGPRAKARDFAPPLSPQSSGDPTRCAYGEKILASRDLLAAKREEFEQAHPGADPAVDHDASQYLAALRLAERAWQRHVVKCAVCAAGDE